MLTQSPTPILSIAPEAAKDLDGRDALSGLWSCRFLLHGTIHMLIYISTPRVFTKCKESLEGARRLENLLMAIMVSLDDGGFIPERSTSFVTPGSRSHMSVTFFPSFSFVCCLFRTK